MTKTGIRILGFVGMLILILSFSNTAIAQNAPPVADAGADQDMIVDDAIILEGSATDPDNNTIVGWQWTLETAPAGTPPYISDLGIADPIFEPRVAGVYVLSLIAFDGLDWSEPDFININVRDIIEPVAVAEADVTIGPAPLTVQFDGSLSTVDPEFGPLTYRWDFDDGSPSSFEVSPSHTYDPTGTFEATLTVQDTDGRQNSATITITVCGDGINCPPVADAGEDQTVFVGESAQLSGSATDPDGDTIEDWFWEIVEKPQGSAPILSGPSTQNPLMIPDQIGEYVVSLEVWDGTDNSQLDFVTVTAVENQPPVAIATADITSGVAPLTVTFDGSQSYDPDDAISYIGWDFGDGGIADEASPVYTYTASGIFTATLTVIDAYGQSARDSIIITVDIPTSQTPQEMIQDLISDVQDYRDSELLNRFQGNRLIALLNRALNSFNNGYTRLTEFRLNRFVRVVNRYIRRGVLTEDEGQALIDDVNEIIGVI